MTPHFAPLAAVLLAASLLPAQDTRGDIFGRVLDPSGAAICGARVHATHSAARETLDSATDRDGEFRFPFLVSGAWSVTVQHPGFRPYREENIAVRPGETATVHIHLQLGP